MLMKLYPTKCKCGKSSTNFKKHIGDFYIDECCTLAGYDHLGFKGYPDEIPQEIIERTAESFSIDDLKPSQLKPGVETTEWIPAAPQDFEKLALESQKAFDSIEKDVVPQMGITDILNSVTSSKDFKSKRLYVKKPKI